MFTNQNKNKNNTYFMKLALEQARKNLGNTSENPSVGCIITKNNSVISAGNTSVKGRPHAEVNAINLSKINVAGSEIYITLEPCSHQGITPPCTKLIVKKKLKKVYFSLNDLDVRSNNKSSSFLKKKQIIVTKGTCHDLANLFYRSYFKSKNDLLPFVTCKMAISKDFFTINKKKKWITNKFSRARGHLLRSYNDCLITSCKTIISDNSRFTCRVNGLKDRSPARIILDTKLKIPLRSHILEEASEYRTIIFYNKIDKNKINKLRRLKVELHEIPIDENQNLDLKQVLLKTKELGFYRVLLESGAKLFSNFLYNNLIDDLYLFTSNKSLRKNGRSNIKKDLKSFLKNKKKINNKVNLFGEKMIIYKIK